MLHSVHYDNYYIFIVVLLSSVIFRKMENSTGIKTFKVILILRFVYRWFLQSDMKVMVSFESSALLQKDFI